MIESEMLNNVNLSIYFGFTSRNFKHDGNIIILISPEILEQSI